ncbi:MAG: hypothetical protein IPL46_27160 [Saprospiraceae bacterium]|nr:hypothetical protein [Saprospiraceae bacterium]
MTSNIYKIVNFVVVLLVSAAFATAKSEYTKTYSKTFNLSPGGKVDIENMHGQVNINTWNKNEVNIKVVITVNASSERKAEDGFERITIEFSNDNQYVSAKTSIDSKRSSWWFIQSWWDDDDMRIDYEVSMPASAKLEMSHKYGNATLGNFSGDVLINHKYGDLTVDQVSGYLQMDVAYGNAVVAKANNAKLDVSYYKLRMNEAHNLHVSSKYSQIYVESANQIISESSYDGYHLGDVGTMSNEGKYDNIEVDKIGQLNINTKYTKINLEHLLNQLHAEMSYGGLEIDRLDAGFSEIQITSRYAGLEIDAGDVQNLKVDVQGRYTGVDLPGNIETSKDQRENNSVTVVGQRGSASSKGMIRVRTEYGGLKIR